MRKLAVLVAISALMVVFLVTGVFILLHLSAHKGFKYDISKGDIVFGQVKVDRYATEGKIIYKSSSRYPYSEEAALSEEKLVLKKSTATPDKFIKTSYGNQGLKRVSMLEQDGEETDYLYLDSPVFLKLSGFETGKKTMVFLPGDIITYMALMDRYNFWKKGTQFFEIMIPVEAPVPPLRDKIKVKYDKDEYVSVAGRKIEAESFILTARSLPDFVLTVSKYAHDPLTLLNKRTGEKIYLTKIFQTPESKLKGLIDNFKEIKNSFLLLLGKEPFETAGSEDKKEAFVQKKSLPTNVVRPDEGGEEIFFESNNVVLSGRFWKPAGQGPFPGMVFIADDGARTNGEQYLLEAMGRVMASNGIAVMSFNGPGQGKSQGASDSLNEDIKARNIADAAAYLYKRDDIDRSAIALCGHRGGGYLALKAAKMSPNVENCIIIGLPETFEKNFLAEDTSKKAFEHILKSNDLGRFDDGFLALAKGKMRSHFEDVKGKKGDNSFFLGAKLPEEAYRGYLNRRPYEALMSFDRPLLFIAGRDEPYFSPPAVEKLKGMLEKENPYAKVAIFRNLSNYAGHIEDENGSPVFVPDKEVFDLIELWVSGDRY